MKKFVKKFFCYLVFISLSFCMIFSVCMVSAAQIQYNGSTEVVAHIETAPENTTEVISDDYSDVEYDDSTVSTGDNILYIAVIVSLIVAFAFVIVAMEQLKNKS